MPSSTVRSFSDVDEYSAAIRQGTVQMTVTGRGHFSAKLIRIDLHRLWMQRFSDDLPRVAHIDGHGERAIISFRTQPGPSMSWAGFDLQPSAILRHRVGGPSFQHTTGPSTFGSMSLPLEDFESVIGVVAGSDVRPPRDTLVATPRVAAMEKLQRLHATAGYLAETSPEIIANPEAARGLEQALVEAAVGCLTEAETAEERSARGRHELVAQRFYRMMEAHPNDALYIPQVCKAIGVAERTLRMCCYDQLGMSPKQFLLVRRMNLVHQALKQAMAIATTVTEAATRYGFYDFGRFAGAYRSLFGELPSMTLARPPE
jgi:AraC-like DNA-binding protein